eukprot:TRINITY_DN19263_c0_g1_i1.p1 TRINITY_DN19263_c0_g1~~TRINITY_DN19263_c0_g1_i1.p1  ORF type:complete len:217 (-),score=44.37 TRINITY_DN19263_c0_g1_i1:66-716(-)
MESSEASLKLVAKVGPICDPESLKTWLKILEFSSQVWINCEQQINLYSQPCGTLLAEVAEKLQKAKVSNKTTFTHPASVLYSLGLEFGRNIDLDKNGRLSAGLAVFFIKWGAFLEQEEMLTYESWLAGFSESLDHVETLGWSGPMFSGLKAIMLSIESSCQDIFSISDILEDAAAAAENAALETKQDNIDVKVDAGAHVVGITSRAVYQAFKITQK